MRRWRSTSLTLALVPALLAAQDPPALPLVERMACPFECCRFGEWTAGEELTVRAAPRASAHVLLRIARHERFTADSGDLHTLRYGVVVLNRALRLLAYRAEEFPEVPASHADSLELPLLRLQRNRGDTLLILGHVPEMGERVWVRFGETVVAPFWAERRDPGAAAEVRRPLRQEWWVRVRTRSGAIGWIDAMHRKIEGYDACGGVTEPAQRMITRREERSRTAWGAHP